MKVLTRRPRSPQQALVERTKMRGQKSGEPADPRVHALPLIEAWIRYACSSNVGPDSLKVNPGPRSTLPDSFRLRHHIWRFQQRKRRPLAQISPSIETQRVNLAPIPCDPSFDDLVSLRTFRCRLSRRLSQRRWRRSSNSRFIHHGRFLGSCWMPLEGCLRRIF